MIPPRRHPLTLPILRRIAAGDADAEAIADAVYPRPRLDGDYPAFRVAFLAWDAQRAERAAEVSALVSRLVEARLVAPRGRPTVAPEFLRAIERQGSTERALAAWHPKGGEALGRLRGYLALLEEMGVGPAGPLPGVVTPSVRELTRTGSRWRRYERLVRWAVVRAPSARELTGKGMGVVG